MACSVVSTENRQDLICTMDLFECLLLTQGSKIRQEISFTFRDTNFKFRTKFLATAYEYVPMHTHIPR
jgi:hypothetical protein